VEGAVLLESLWDFYSRNFPDTSQLLHQVTLFLITFS